MIGIFGGTFDPVHYGHLRAALEVKEIFGLDEVRLIPSAQPPHRGQPSATAEKRLKMLKCAVEQQPGFMIDTRELERPGLSYMVDTLHSLRVDFSDQPLLLFIGTDAFNKIKAWHKWQALFDYAHIVVLTRPGFSRLQIDDFFTTRLINDKQALAQSLFGNLYFQTITQLDISASAIRALIAEGRNPRFLLPDAVLNYIKQYNLYQTKT
jgi:nicotinate-nucleotide adenylyltransferase